jgi:hypothetical protein
MSRNPLPTSYLRLRYVVIIPVLDTYLEKPQVAIHSGYEQIAYSDVRLGSLPAARTKRDAIVLFIPSH